MNKQDTSMIVQEVVNRIMECNNTDAEIPIGISARHCHLCEDDFNTLFGDGYELTKKADLSQPGQFAANEKVTVAGPKGSLANVRILGPVRSKSQVEVSQTDTFSLGLNPPVRESGNIENSSPVTLVGPKGSVYLHQGLIIAKAHIHMHPDDAENYRVANGETVSVLCKNEQRSIQFRDVVIRVSPKYRLEMHVDTDEANAGVLGKNQKGKLIKEEQQNDGPKNG